ncbi:hypothetical protein Tco_0472995 [Tanacetum coccineum]
MMRHSSISKGLLAHSRHPGSGTAKDLRMMFTSVPDPSRPHAHTPSSKIHSRHQSRLKESSKLQKIHLRSSDNQRTPSKISRRKRKGRQKGNGPQKAKVITMVRCHGKDRKRKSMLVDRDWMNIPVMFPTVAAGDFSDMPFIVEAKIEGNLTRNIHVDEGASIEIMYEHCFNNLHPSIKACMTETQTTVSRFAGERVK